MQALKKEIKLREIRRKAEAEADQRQIARLKEEEDDARRLREAMENVSIHDGESSESSSKSELSIRNQQIKTSKWVRSQSREVRLNDPALIQPQSTLHPPYNNSTRSKSQWAIAPARDNSLHLNQSAPFSRT